MQYTELDRLGMSVSRFCWMPLFIHDSSSDFVNVFLSSRFAGMIVAMDIKMQT